MEAAPVQGGALKNDRQSRPHRLAADAVAAYQRGCGTNDEHAIADLICDLGHLAEEGASIFSRRSGEAFGHWYAEHHSHDRDNLGPDAAVEIAITPR